MAKNKPFRYEGKPGTCLWCGKKVTEDYAAVHPAGTGELLSLSTGGEVFFHRKHRVVKKLVPIVNVSAGPPKFHITRPRRAKADEVPDFYHAFFDPPIYKGYPMEVNGNQEPAFDSLTCAAQFALRVAELGHRLTDDKTLATRGEP